jgi:hypothetical protein
VVYKNVFQSLRACFSSFNPTVRFLHMPAGMQKPIPLQADQDIPNAASSTRERARENKASGGEARIGTRHNS